MPEKLIRFLDLKKKKKSHFLGQTQPIPSPRAPPIIGKVTLLFLYSNKTRGFGDVTCVLCGSPNKNQMPVTLRSFGLNPRDCKSTCSIFLRVCMFIHFIQQKWKWLFMIPSSSFTHIVRGGKKKRKVGLVGWFSCWVFLVNSLMVKIS